MLPRLAHISRHLSPAVRRMTSPTSDLFAKPIRTAACLIIADEVLNGKVCAHPPGGGVTERPG